MMIDSSNFTYKMSCKHIQGDAITPWSFLHITYLHGITISFQGSTDPSEWCLHQQRHPSSTPHLLCTAGSIQCHPTLNRQRHRHTHLATSPPTSSQRRCTTTGLCLEILPLQTRIMSYFCVNAIMRHIFAKKTHFQPSKDRYFSDLVVQNLYGCKQKIAIVFVAPWHYLVNLFAMYLGAGNTTTRLPGAGRGCCPPWTCGGTGSPPPSTGASAAAARGKTASTTRGSTSDTELQPHLPAITTLHHHETTQP